MGESAGVVANAPDGNGGLYPALQGSGCLARLQTEGVKYLHVFSVDNALCRPADPRFVGYCISKDADCGNKCVWKVSPDEKVGVVAKKDGRSAVVEYSELDEARKSAGWQWAACVWCWQHLQPLLHGGFSCGCRHPEHGDHVPFGS